MFASLRRLLGNRRPIVSACGFKPCVEELESLIAPSTLYQVRLESAPAGVHGSAACSIIAGGLRIRSEYDPDGNGTALVQANSRLEAIRMAIEGTVVVNTSILPGLDDVSYQFGADNVSNKASAHLPFLLKGDRIWLEDLAAFPQRVDWDYNDDYWLVSVSKFPGKPKFDFTSKIWQIPDSGLREQLFPIAAIQQVAKPVSEPKNMGEIVGNLEKILGSKEASDRLLEQRKNEAEGNSFFWDVATLNQFKDRKQLSAVQIVDAKNAQGVPIGGKVLLASFIWGQNLSVENYTGPLIQAFKFDTKITLVNGKSEEETRVQVEGFPLSNGKPAFDLQTINRSFDPAVVKSIEQTITVRVGAGTYTKPGADNPEKIEKFAVLEKHLGTLQGKIDWANPTTGVLSYTLKITVDNKGNRTFTGPFSN